VASRYAVEANGGIDSLAMTNLDRLCGKDTVMVCTAYEYVGTETAGLDKYFLHERNKEKIIITGIKAEAKKGDKSDQLAKMLFECRPSSWKIFDGWEIKKKAKSESDLPKQMRTYLDYIQSPEGLGVSLSILSIGPTRFDKIEL